MSVVILEDFGTYYLESDFLSDESILPISQEAFDSLMSQLSNGDLTAVRVIGGAYYEVIIVSKSNNSLIYERGACGTEERDFFEGDCVIAYENTANCLGSPESDDCLPISTSTPDFIEVSFNCDTGYEVNYIGSDPLNPCDTELNVTPHSGTKIYVSKCEYITIAQLCEALNQCHQE